MPTPPKPRTIAPGTVRLPHGDDAGNQLAVMEFLQTYINLHGYSPTVIEIGEHINRTRPTVRKALNALEGAGLITRAPNNRAITIVTD